ncbi:MAG: deoxyribodipyrimidine photo-lyase [Buchnera aphidicola (Nurudea yanoniella)]
MITNLVWFRNDLRIRDNLALYSACKNEKSIILGLFVFVPAQWKFHSISYKKSKFIYNSLVILKKDLMKLNIFLYFHESTTFLQSIKYITEFCKKKKIDNLYYNYEYGFFEKQRDILVEKKLKNYKISSYGFHSSTLITPGTIKNIKGNMYSKYSNFKKKCILILLQKKLVSLTILKRQNTIIDTSHFHIPIFKFPFEKFNTQIFPIGELKAIKKLKFFLKRKFNDYDINRNYFSLNSTSMLSVYFSIGILSPIRCFLILHKYYSYTKYKKFVENCSWINELIWREFFKHLLYFYPKLSKQQVLCDWEKNIKWEKNKKNLNAWKKGETGFPIIDSAMKQLNQMGWMHNRLRMITSSFLVKNLLINWREGEKYFMSKLIDGDTALNNGGWQWIASVGLNNIPYFRIFNPLLQSKKFDKNGTFIKKYIPELKKLSAIEVHNPSLWNKETKKIVKYPKKIVSFSETKKIALKIFKFAKCKL